MASQKNIAICFSKEDNHPVKEGAKGWITNFHKFLFNLLYQISDEPIQIDLVTEDEIGSTGLEKYQAVIVISTEALQSVPELTTAISNLANSLQKGKMLYSDGISRIFKVHKRPQEHEANLEVLHDLIAYDFYLIDPLTGEAQEFTRFFGNDAERSYWMKMIDMAYDLNQLLSATSSEAKLDEMDKTVYLASAGMDLMIQRDIIKRELLRHGFRVLPHHTLPNEASALEKVVQEDLEKCRIAIHMVGEDYGFKPLGSETSVVDIQNRLAANHLDAVAQKRQKGDKRLFSRLIWLAPDLKNVTERQKIFIEDLKSDAALLDDAEVLQIPLSEFKSIIREELITGGRLNTHANRSGADAGAEHKKVIYLIHDRSDIEKAKPLQDYLTQSGYQVVAPSYDGDLAAIRTIHQENLRKCDGSIIYFGKSKEDWIKTKLQDLLKAPGFGREKKLLAKAVYCEGQKEMDPMVYERNHAMILGNNGSFKPEHLKPFLSKIEEK